MHIKGIYQWIILLSILTFSMCTSALPPLNQIYHPVSTQNKEAQQHFDRGLTYIFAFNHDLAFQEFKKASELDPNLAMAYWGMALALGQNINIDVTPEKEQKAFALSRKALELSDKATPVEKSYINALAVRYTNDPNADLVALRFVYRDAMKKVMAQYPEDLDAATLYVESILDLHPWDYWTWDGKPREGTLEAADVLESVLRRNPLHIGANHYHIHVWEESPFPERALMSAVRLTTLLPESGHLLHMPTHIFLLLGDYDSAIKTNKNAIAADKKYIKEHGMEGEYPLHYLSHNFSILARTYMLDEQYDNAIQTAFELLNFQKPYYEHMHDLARFMIVPMEVNLYFHRWRELLAYNPPNLTSPIVKTYWHFARAIAYANFGMLNAALKEKTQMQKSKQNIPFSAKLANNPARNVFDLAEVLLDANLMKAKNHPLDYIQYLKKAVTLQDRLEYDEPPAWYMPVRMELGEALLAQKRYAEAETVFNTALQHLRRNKRLLRGLHQSLQKQQRTWDAFWVQRIMGSSSNLIPHV